MEKLTAYQVSRWFLYRNNANVRQYDGELLTHLKIQKLLYYAQGLFLAYTGEPIFNEEIYAWEHGPVVREVYEIYKGAKSNPIEYKHIEEDEELIMKVYENEDYRNVLEVAFAHYGKYSAWHLRGMTHGETPWKTTSLNELISKEKIRKFFEEEVLES